MIKYVIVRADGGISVPAEESVKVRAGETLQEAMKRLLEKWSQSARPEWLPARLETTEIPLPDRDFHGARMQPGPQGQLPNNAWCWNEQEKCVKIDLVLARENYCRRRIRQARARKFLALDLEYMQAHEAMDSARLEIVVGKKQALRDAPADARIEALDTPEAIKAFWPECLA